MGFHLFPIITFFMASLVATNNAELPPQIYWKSLLPETPMPKAITNLLHPSGHIVLQNSDGLTNEKFTSVDYEGDGTDVNVGGGNGGVSVGAGKRGKPVHVGVGYSPFDYVYAATETQLHHDPNVALFFLEETLHHGSQINLHFTKPSNLPSFIPRRLADSIPFASTKAKEIFKKLSIKPDSDDAESMINTIIGCEKPAISGEEKQCVNSLESMVDFCTSKIGKNVAAVSTEVSKESVLQKYTVTKGVKKLGEKEGAVCHLQNYPYAVFYCHKTETIEAYYVPLEGADGSRVKAIAVCHTNTLGWNPKHLAFQVLKVEPGTLPVCHFLPEDHVVWVPK